MAVTNVEWCCGEHAHPIGAQVARQCADPVLLGVTLRARTVDRRQWSRLTGLRRSVPNAHIRAGQFRLARHANGVAGVGVLRCNGALAALVWRRCKRQSRKRAKPMLHDNDRAHAVAMAMAMTIWRWWRCDGRCCGGAGWWLRRLERKGKRPAMERAAGMSGGGWCSGVDGCGRCGVLTSV